ncbi:LOW QUALITY PROTEIN: C10orf142 isoform 1 [Pongo abelii]|uniref:C10orf142 isoform 1 n=1 Tax=Pongo abelii TaxID=9601 RepID=A0A2J8XTA7_PONAB|nr:LOW QUALITY PROTEIN: C10orf142 isoform 1 [Pongo abelii]
MRMYSSDAHERPPSPSLGTTPPPLPPTGNPRPRQDSAAGNSEEREPRSLGRASGVGSSCKRPTVCMGRQQGLPFCTVCGYRCSSPERTRGRCAVGKVRVAGGGGAPGGGVGMRCCGC